MKKIILMALVALTLFSCSNEAENIPEVESGNAALYLAIAMPKTKAMTDPVTTPPTVITKLMVQAYDATDKAVGALSIISGQTLTDLLAANGMAPGTDSKQIVVETISNNATYIRVWGYHDVSQTDTPIYTGAEAINTLQALGFDGVPYQADKILIAKSQNLGTGAHAEHKVWTATATLKPYLARFEVSGTPKSKADGDLKNASIQVSGIYMNNISLKGKTAPTLKAGNSAHWDFSTAKDNDGGNWEDSYYTDYVSMFDGLPAAPTVLPAPALVIQSPVENNSIWYNSKNATGYNLYPQDETPHLVLCVVVDKDGSDATTNDQYYGFVTVSKFRKGNGLDATIPTDGTGLLSGIINGNLYQIDLSDLLLTEKDITPDPEPKEQDLYLKLTVTPWNAVKLTPEL